MRQHTVIRAMEGGLLGTLLQTMAVYGVMPLMLGQSVDPAAMLAHPCAVGLLAHVFSGGVLFPLAYVCLLSQDFQGSPVLKGMLWGGSSGASPRSSLPQCWVQRSSVQRWVASLRRDVRCSGTLSMVPHLAALSAQQISRVGVHPAAQDG